MLPRITDARHVGAYRIWLRFADGLAGEIDLADQLFGPVFEPLKDVVLFAQVRLDPEIETITWPNGADLSPEWLCERLRLVMSAVAE